jgi:hypothetical protein
MDVNIEEYSEKLSELMNGFISEQEWMDYCKTILEDVMEANKDVYIRMKESGD